MPPNVEEHISSLKIKPPEGRGPGQNGMKWLEGKHSTDGAEGLWRIHDKLYDLTDFIQKHPGGVDWLKLTKGTDITEAFEVHHLTNKPEEILKKYYIRDAKTKRNAPYTFKEDGFYKTLKREVQKVLKNLPEQPVNTSAFFTDALLVLTFIFACLANNYWSYKLGLGAAVLFAYLAVAAHNYIHRKDNFRMHYFDLTLMQSREIRIIHALSHHLHTNTIDDLQVIILEPYVQILPEMKTNVKKYLILVIFPIIWGITFQLQYIVRMYKIVKGDFKSVFWSDLIPYTLPLVMYLTTDRGIFETLWMWSFIIFITSFYWTWIGNTSAHFHPDIWIDGDTPRPPVDDYDWGLSQLDTIMERKEIEGSHFMVLTHYGDHALHHLFPTLDHGTLELLYPTFKEVCEKFNVNVRVTTQWDMIKGFFWQAARVTPNPNPPDLLKKYF